MLSLRGFSICSYASKASSDLHLRAFRAQSDQLCGAGDIVIEAYTSINKLEGRQMKSLAIAGIVVALSGLGGCLKPEPVLYRVSLGMSEKQLLEALGPPLSVREEGEGKTFEYQSWTNNLHGKPVHRHDWHVHLFAGRVDAYGLNKAGNS